MCALAAAHLLLAEGAEERMNYFESDGAGDALDLLLDTAKRAGGRAAEDIEVQRK